MTEWVSHVFRGSKYAPARLHGSDNIFSTWADFFFSPPPLSSLYKTWQSLLDETSKGTKKREVAWENKLFFFFLFNCMSAPLCRRGERQAGSEAWGGGGGSVLVRLFKFFADWLPPALACGAGRAHSSLWLQLMKHSCCLRLPSTWRVHAPQIQATAMRRGQPRQTHQTHRIVANKNSSIRAAFVLILCCLYMQPEWMCWALLLSCPSSDQGEAGRPGGGRRRQRRLREPNQEDQVWHQTDQGVRAIGFSMQV